jgi:cell division protein FtsB
MEKAKMFRFILMALLIGVTVFSLIGYILTLRENADLSHSLNQIKIQVVALQTEKIGLLKELDNVRQLEQQVSQENVQLKDKLKADEDRLADLIAQLDKANSQISILTAENTTVRQQNQDLKEENDKYKNTFNSLSELKKAIGELKIKIRQAKRKINLEEQIIGNQGYLIREGKSTYPGKVKIEVQSLPK